MATMQLEFILFCSY